MRKNDVIKLFGGSGAAAARKLQITRQAFHQWPEDLDTKRIDLVIGAAYRHGIEIPEHLEKIIKVSLCGECVNSM